MLMAYEAEGEATCEAGDLPPSLHRLKKKKEQHEERFPPSWTINQSRPISSQFLAKQ